MINDTRQKSGTTKEIKSIRNSKDVTKYKTFFVTHKISLKETWLFKTKKIKTKYHNIYNIGIRKVYNQYSTQERREGEYIQL